ncbi:MAG: hypothetical protein ACYCW6_00640 [Candidatus Xenobia bacterium]
MPMSALNGLAGALPASDPFFLMYPQLLSTGAQEDQAAANGGSAGGGNNDNNADPTEQPAPAAQMPDMSSVASLLAPLAPLFAQNSAIVNSMPGMGSVNAGSAAFLGAMGPMFSA